MKRQVDVELMGGIGNQLFQYFAAASLATKFNCEFRLVKSNRSQHEMFHVDSAIEDLVLTPQEGGTRVSCFEKHPRLTRILYSSALRSNTIAKVATVFGFYVDSQYRSVRAKSKRIYLKGYFQRISSFDELSLFFIDITLREPSNWFNEIVREIENNNSVGIHLRLGDYLALDESYGRLDYDYYIQALSLLPQNHGKILIFSDDIELAKVYFAGISGFNFEYVDPPGDSSAAESLMLLSKCKHLIIANSTFSYWAALFGKKGNMIIYPKPWLRLEVPDSLVFPDSWIPVNSNLD